MLKTFKDGGGGFLVLNGFGSRIQYEAAVTLDYPPQTHSH